MKQITMTIPDNCEVQIIKKKEDKENKEDKKIRTYQDLIDNKIKVKGYYISNINSINDADCFASDLNKNIALSEKVAKSMLAMAMISQLMSYYGGPITDEEWKNDSIKYVIGKYTNDMYVTWHKYEYYFLAFHTAEQRNEFLKYNKQLVKDYLMID